VLGSGECLNFGDYFKYRRAAAALWVLICSPETIQPIIFRLVGVVVFVCMWATAS